MGFEPFRRENGTERSLTRVDVHANVGDGGSPTPSAFPTPHGPGADLAEWSRRSAMLPFMLRQSFTNIDLQTRGRGLLDITQQVTGWVGSTGMADGLLTLFLKHTSASLLIQENADPAVRADLDRFFAKLVPDGDPLFKHDDEGPDDMPAHVRTALTAVQLSIPLAQGELALGTWQGIYVWEHRLRPHRRSVALHLVGE